MAEKLPDSIPEFETLDEIADIWDTHSTADYEGLTYEANLYVKLKRRR